VDTGHPGGISVVVPVYNGADALAELTRRLEHVLKGTGGEFELILVDDCSSDGSWQVISGLAAEHCWVRGFSLMRNYGQHNALLCGIRQASFPVTVTMDDDLQNPPEEIPGLLAALDGSTDVVYGTPVREKHSIWRVIASALTKSVLRKSMGVETASSVSAFRAFRTCLRDSFALYGGPFVSIDVLLTWGSTRFRAITVDHASRKYGKSNYTLGMLIRHALNMMTGFSTLPLEVASVLGFAFTAFGILVLLYVLIRFILEGGSVPGFPFLASIIAIFSGVQLFSLGIIGEYLARVHFRTMDKPPFTVRESTGPAGETCDE
jgi:undecaprenyl-phosphate 4-deoxy-4-formamido-L-arabinose transferase